MSAGTLKEKPMDATSTELIDSNQHSNIHNGMILPKTFKGRARLHSRLAASSRKLKRTMESKAKKAEKAQKAAERAAAKADKKEKLEQEKAKKIAQSLADANAARIALAEGDEIALKEAGYHEKYVKNANGDLYKLLQIIMAFVEKIIASAHKDAIVSHMRHTLKHAHHIGTQKNTPTANIVVRYVTRTSRKNACVYGRVINKALEDGVKSKDLIDYIEQHQGIDNIRKQVVSKEKEPVTMSQKELENKKFLGDFGESYLNSRAKSGNYMGKFTLDNKFSSTSTDATRFSNFKYFACDYVNGEYVIVDVVPVDPDFEPTLFERISNYRLQCNVHHQEVADAMCEAAKSNGRTFKEPLYIAQSN
jgi:hypothetical protein